MLVRMSSEEYIKNEDLFRTIPLTVEEENEYLKATVDELKKEIERFKKAPYIVATVIDVKDEDAIVTFNGGKFYVTLSNAVKGRLKPDDQVLLDQKTLTIVSKIGRSKHFDVSNLVIIDKPKISWGDIGGLDEQINELQEVVELPLLKPELFVKIGIEPPKGILLYGPPGTGKTLLAKAAARNSKATFIELVGSELVQKFIGEGTKYVKSLFELAREKAPSVIFIDEIDAIAAKRIEVGTSGEREVQRTFMQLLAELDGFKPLDNVKVIGATNRLDILDPAITRPGRLDRIIEIPLPDKEGRKNIFNIYIKKLNTSGNIDADKLASLTEGVSGADIKSICTEAGYFAIRENKEKITMKHIEKAIRKVLKKDKQDDDKKEHIPMFG